MTKLIFVGENRSPTAIARGWTWKDGHLAARPLFEALVAMGLDPADQTFVNLFVDGQPGKPLRVNYRTVIALREAISAGTTIVALGQKVARGLALRGLVHTVITHPAARGKIRKRERYIAHVCSTLAPKPAPKLEVHSHSYVYGPNAHRSPSRKVVHSHEGGNERHQHDELGPATYTIDKDEWFAKTGLRGGGRKKFTTKPSGPQLASRVAEWPKPYVLVTMPNKKVA